MVTIHRQHGLRVVVDDHEPAHVHVFGDGEAKIDLIGSGGQPELLWTEGMNRAEVRKAMRIVVESQLHFLQRWQEIHG
jgi:hypothetical protein